MLSVTLYKATAGTHTDAVDTFGSRLAQLLQANKDQGTGITSLRQLSIRMAELVGSKPENERRELTRIVNQAQQPGEKKASQIRRAGGWSEEELPTPDSVRSTAHMLRVLREDGVALDPEDETVQALLQAGDAVRRIEHAVAELHSRLERIEGAGEKHEVRQ